MSESRAPAPIILHRPEHCISRKDMDPDALKVMVRLHRHGFKAYLVGGSVRDLLLRRQPKDFDVSTDAHPGQIRKLFRNSRIIGRRFRLVHVFFPNQKNIEVSTFRRAPEEEPLEDAARQTEPKKMDNTFGAPHEDALRRDLTVNGLFYDIGTFSVLDYVGGIEDLKAGIIRTIGDPDTRFREDPLRMIRAVRHTIRIRFRIEPATLAALVRNAPLLQASNVSRLQDEFQKDLEGGFFCPTLRFQKELGLLKAYFPALDRFLDSSPALDPPPRFDGAWFWRGLAILDSPASEVSRRRFRLATLLFPLLERRLADPQTAAAGPPPAGPGDTRGTGPGDNQGAGPREKPDREGGGIHGLLHEVSSPVGIARRDREGLESLWGGWIRLLRYLDAGRIPPRVQQKPYFPELLAWHRFHQETCGRLREETEEMIARAMAAGGGASGRPRRGRRRRRPGPPQVPDSA